MRRLWAVVCVWLLTLAVVPGGAAAAGRSEAIRHLIRARGLEARLLWMDLSANLARLDTPEEVAEIVRKAREAGFNTLIVSVKNHTGFVAYRSRLAPHVSQAQRITAWNYMPDGVIEYRYADYPADYDLLQTVVDAARREGLTVLASINVFTEGSTAHQEGPAFQHPDWQTVYYDVYRVATAPNGSTRRIDAFNGTRYENYLVVYTPDQYNVAPTNRWGADVVVESGIVTAILDRAVTDEPAPAIPPGGYVLSGHGTARTWILENLRVGDRVDIDQTRVEMTPAAQYTSSIATFVNPAHPEVREYELGLIRELITNYDIDGITLDYARYSNVYADFSDLSRQQFEAYIGQPVANWPEDIFQVTFAGNTKRIVPGPLFTRWIEWRAKNIYDFFAEAEQVVRSVKPDALFTAYVGSWYPIYYHEGVNWAANTYIPPYDWASADYHKYGYATLVDFLMTGLYYSDITKEEALAHGGSSIYSVEGAAELSIEVTDGGTLVYGSIYAEMHAPPGAIRSRPDPTDFKRAVRMAADETHGVMVFDLVHLEPGFYDWWDAVAECFARPARAPHEIPGLRQLLRGR